MFHSRAGFAHSFRAAAFFLAAAALPATSAPSFSRPEFDRRGPPRIDSGESSRDAEGAEEPAVFPARLRSVEGKAVDVERLAREKRLVVVTLKATWCEVCQHQLYRIKKKLAESEACGLTYLVLAPGPREDLRAIQAATGFPFPFVEDEGLRIAESLGLRMDEAEIMPAILILNSDRTVGWVQMGRGEGVFGDPELFQALKCAEWI